MESRFTQKVNTPLRHGDAHIKINFPHIALYTSHTSTNFSTKISQDLSHTPQYLRACAISSRNPSRQTLRSHFRQLHNKRNGISD